MFDKIRHRSKSDSSVIIMRSSANGEYMSPGPIPEHSSITTGLNKLPTQQYVTTPTLTKSHFLKSHDLKTVLNEDADQSYSGVAVVATIGPSCHEVSDLVQLLKAGAVGARFDLTWGGTDFHRTSMANLQEAMGQTRKICCTMIDTLGREVMIRRHFKIDEKGWPVHDESFIVKAGQQVTITTRSDVQPSNSVLPITYDNFHEMAQPGDTIYIGRYLVSGTDSASLYVEVEEVHGRDVVCTARSDAVLDGLLTVFHIERSATALENVQNTLPLLSDYDKEAIKTLAREFEIDFISLSYTRTEEDIHEARAWLHSIGCGSTRILAKLETRQSVLNFEGILSAADGIIISRGNLGLDVPPEKMAAVQKQLVNGCNLAGKPCLLTRVVDTMESSPRPTRAEATDVANAVLDGVDGILLGAETLRGKFPADAVQTVCRICCSADKVYDHEAHFDYIMARAVEEEDRVMEAAEAAGMSVSGASTHSNGPPSTGQYYVNAYSHGPATAPSSARQTGHHDTTLADGLLHTSPGASHNDLMQAELLGGHDRRTPVGYNLNAKKPSGLPPKSPPSKMGGTAGGLSSTSLAQDAASVQGVALVPRIHRGVGLDRSPFLSKLESIASSAVRAADKVAASLMVVYTHTGATAQLVCKYRPPVPILALVVPHLASDGLTWKLQGRGYARQCQILRGVIPVLANPAANGDESLNQAVYVASTMGLVKPHDHVVVVERTNNDFCVKMVSVNEMGCGVKRLPRVFGSCPAEAFQEPSHHHHHHLTSSFSGIPFASTPSISIARTSTIHSSGNVNPLMANIVEELDLGQRMVLPPNKGSTINTRA